MARPQKEGLDYWPHDVNMLTDDKVEYLVAKEGFIAYGVLNFLYDEIYKNGYYTKFEKRQKFVYAKRMTIEADLLEQIVGTCFEAEIFNRDIYEAYHVLTSRGIQRRYQMAVKKRKADLDPRFDVDTFPRRKKEETAVSDEKTLVSDAEIKDSSNRTCPIERSETVSEIKTLVSDAETRVSDEKTPQNKSKENIYDVVDTRARARGNGDDDLAEVISLFSNNIHPVTGEIEADTLKDLLDTYKKMWVTEAIKEAALHHGTSVQYIVKILECWARDGFKAQKPKGGTRNAGRVTGDSRPHHVDTPGLRRLKEDMRWADEHQTFPWEVQSESGGSGETPAGHSAD